MRQREAGPEMANALPWSVRGIDPDIREQAVEAAHRSGMSVGQWLNHVLADNLDDEIDDEPPAYRSRSGHRRNRRFDQLSERVARLGGQAPMTAAHRFATRDGEAPVLDLIESAVNAIERLDQRASAPQMAPRAAQGNEAVVETLRAFERKLDALAAGALAAKPYSHAGANSLPDEDPAFTRALAEIEARRRDLDGDRHSHRAFSGPVGAAHQAAPSATSQAAPASAPSAAVDARHIDSMRETLDTLVTRIDEMRQRPAPDNGHIQNQLNELSRRIEEWRADPRDEINTMRRDLANLASAVEQMSPARLVGMVENSVSALAERAIRAQREGMPQNLAEPLERVHEDIRAVLREVSSSRGTDRLSQEVNNLARRLDLMSEAAPDASRLDAIGREMDGIKALVSQALRSQPLEGLARQIDALSQQVDKFRTAPNTPDRSLLDAIRDVGDRLDRIDPRASFAGIETRLAAISGIETKLDDIARGMKKLAKEAQPLPKLENIAERLERIDRVLDSANGTPFAGLDQLTSRLERIGETLDRASETQPAEHDTLVAMLEKLSERIDQAQSAKAESPALDALQDEIARMAKRMEALGGQQAGLDGIERGVSDLFAQLDLTRKDIREATEGAALRAAQEAVRTAPRDEASETLAAEGLLLIKRDLNEFKTTQSDADKRTRQTLEALHGTLETLVGKLGEIEARARIPAVPPAPLQPEPRLAMPEPIAAPQRIAEPPPAPPTKPASSPQFAAPAPGSSGVMDDLPLEPGMRPQSSESIEQSVDPRSKFIAAARRAQKQAEKSQAELSDEVSNGKVTRANRAGASAAAGGMTTFIVRARKPLLLGLAALVFSVGALKVINTRFVAPGPVRTEKPSISQPQAAPEQPVETPRGEVPQTTGSIGPRSQVSDLQAMPTLPAGQIGKTSQRLSDGSALVQADPLAAGHVAADGSVRPIEKGRAAIEELVAQANLRGQDKLREAAIQGNSAALFELGSRYADGRNAPRDPKLAARWFEQAAANGHGPSQYRLGALYREGRGVAKDASLAFQWFDRAAAQGHVLAMHNAAVLLAEGVHGAPDYAGAALWFKRAAEHGIKDSQFNVAILFARGLGVNQDLIESYRWFSIAAAQGDQDAAKKRDDLAGRLTKEQIAKENERIKAFKPIQPNAAANDPGSWDRNTRTGT